MIRTHKVHNPLSFSASHFLSIAVSECHASFYSGGLRDHRYRGRIVILVGYKKVRCLFRLICSVSLW